MRGAVKKRMRRLTLRLLFFLPQARRITLERWLRGREDFRQLARADCVVVSSGKSGRTWLRVMLSRFYQVKHELPQHYLIEFDNFHRTNRAIPIIFFTHDNYIKDYTKHPDSKVDFYDKKVILLVRNPQDVAVSQFFQWKHRTSPGKKILNNFPTQDESLSIFDFVMDARIGLPKIIAFLNGWERELPRCNDILVVRYEDLRTHPHDVLQRILTFIGTPGTDEQITEAVEFASFDHMKKLEEQRAFRSSGSRLVPRDPQNPNTYKVRRAKVGGYRDYFDDEQIRIIDELVHTTLAPSYGYGAATELPGH